MSKNINTKRSKAKEIANILLAMVCIGNISGVTKVDAAALAPITRVIAVPDSNEDQLLKASRTDNLLEVQRLLNEPSIDVNARDARNMTPLHIAAGNGNLEIVQELVAAGTSVNAINNDGETALDIAVRNDYIQVIARLIEAGGLLKVELIKTTEEELLEGARENDIGRVRICLGIRGVNVNAKDRFRRTALHYLAFNDHVAEVVILIAAGANVDAADKDGMTPLHWSAQGGALNSARVLIAAGVDLSAFDKLGLKALDYTDQYGYNEISELIKEAQLVYSSSIRARAKACFGRVVRQIKKAGNGARRWLYGLNLEIGRCLDHGLLYLVCRIFLDPRLLELLVFYLDVNNQSQQ